MVVLQAVVSAIQTRPPSRWLTHENVFAKELGLEEGDSYSAVDELNGFVSSIENGGMGVRSRGTYVSNPAPFDAKIKLSDFVTNRLRCNYIQHTGTKVKTEDRIELAGPSPQSLVQPAKYYHTGKVNGFPSLDDQLNIARFCVGTHRTLLNHYPAIGKRRRELVEFWVAGDSRGNAYEKLDLPILATAFSEHWDVYVCPEGSNLTPTVLAKVREEIIALLVASYVVSPPNGYGTVARRSERIAVQDTGRADAHNVVPAPSNKRRITLPPPQEEINDDDDDDDEDAEMMDTDDDAVKLQKKWLAQFNLETLKQLWRDEKYEEVGRLEIALTNAHDKKDREYTNSEINSLGGSTFSVVDYEAIEALGLSVLGRKRRNIGKLRKWINDNSFTKLYQVYDEMRLLEYARRGGDLWLGGEGLASDIYEPSGQLKTEVAQMIRHIIYTCPGIGISKFPEIFAYCCVIFTGKEPKRIPSASTIRLHIARLNQFDLEENKQMYEALAKDVSPYGTPRMIGIITDDTKHGERDKRHVVILSCDSLRSSDKRDSNDVKERWAISPVYILCTTGKAVTPDCEGNSDLNVEVIWKLLPRCAFHLYNSFVSDNANDAVKEGRLTWDKHTDRMIEEGLEDETMVNGVVRKAKQLGDSFHVHQLVVKWMSEVSCGKTEKGNHEQNHHRQVSFIVQ